LKSKEIREIIKIKYKNINNLANVSKINDSVLSLLLNKERDYNYKYVSILKPLLSVSTNYLIDSTKKPKEYLLESLEDIKNDYTNLYDKEEDSLEFKIYKLIVNIYENYTSNNFSLEELDRLNKILRDKKILSNSFNNLYVVKELESDVLNKTKEDK
jgi:hypothetical protein